MIELEHKKLLKSKEESGAGKVYKIRDVQDERVARHLERLYEQNLQVMRALHYILTNKKDDKERDDILKQLKIQTEQYRDIGGPKFKSENIDEVVEAWRERCGDNNRWIRALEAFRDAGGNIKWISGYPHPGAFVHFSLFDDKWNALLGHTLTHIKRYTKRLRGVI